MNKFRKDLSEDDQKLVTVKESDKVYKFGGGVKKSSLMQVTFPVCIAG